VIFFSFVPQHICRRLRKLFEVCRLAKPSHFINCDKTELGQCLNYSYIVITQFFSIIYCIGSRCRRVAVLKS
jgi:hypothetical protein